MRAALLSLSILPCLAAWPAMAATGPVKATYEVYFGGLHVLSAESEFVPAADTYELTTRAETRGILDLLFGWHGISRSAGSFFGDRAVPDLHVNRGWRGDRQRSVVIEYGPEGQVVTAEVEPAPDPEEVTEVPAGSEQGTVDPLTVIAQVSRAVARSGRCEGEFAVYDGRRRYDLRITDRGTEALPATDYSIFSGEAMRCGVEYAMLGGQRKDPNKYAKTARERVVYVARPLENGPALPVGLKVETDFGTLMAHITGVEAESGITLGDAGSRRRSR
ncbi:MAG: DUF3108 domain-containing protein [Alphaproteobacteria bacterium]|nr:DUF3108 domain-containing protein [Alphaproteobacteria bacterium]